MNDFRTVELNIAHRNLVWIHCSFRNPVLISVNKGKYRFILTLYQGWIKLQHTRRVKNLPTANRWFKIYVLLSTFTLLIITLCLPPPPKKKKLSIRMGHFRVAPSLCFKCEAIEMKMTLYSHFHKRGFALFSFWKWELLDLGNSLLFSITPEYYSCPKRKRKTMLLLILRGKQD